ncbi:glycosyltransferase family 2 protein [bacterium]|nr:glycosyltransferase family 2 protein [bacterium]
MDTPVALIFFNRPNTVAKVFSEIAKAKPKKLFLIADGPRVEHPDDIEKCAAARAAVDCVDWECQIFKDFSDENLGVGIRPSSGISWVFEQVDRAIIFEDDCLPHPSFFVFCEELLERYKHNPRVMQISGWCPFESYFARQFQHSYYFSRALSGHGWATWARAWRHFDYDMLSWPELRRGSWLKETLSHPRMAKFIRYVLDRNYNATGKHGWDQQWNLAVWSQNGLGIRPHVNLIHYLGFGEGATHDFWCKKVEYYDQLYADLHFPLRHPPSVERDEATDRFIYDTFFSSGPKLTRLRAGYNDLRRLVAACLPPTIKTVIKQYRAKFA